jgi:hypothetical protein
MRHSRYPPVSPEGLAPEGLLQKDFKFPTGNKAGAEARKVGGFDLAVDKIEIKVLSARDERDERRLGGVCPRREHRLAEEGVADLYSGIRIPNPNSIAITLAS